jgi:hypothetical protein
MTNLLSVAGAVSPDEAGEIVAKRIRVMRAIKRLPFMALELESKGRGMQASFDTVFAVLPLDT